MAVSRKFVLTVGIILVGFSGSNNTLIDNQDSDTENEYDLVYDYYRLECPNAETIVFQTTRDIFSIHTNLPAQLLRLMFHDCFIQGCDASLLLDDSHGDKNHSIEKNAVPNQTIKAFEIIDRIKQALETECPGVVSCADIIALATRDSIILSGGPFFPLLTGRRDSLLSYFDEANHQLPSPDSNITEILLLFSQKGFNEKETATLLGAHNIGKISCKFIEKRLSNFSGTGKPDPSIPPDFFVELNRVCDSPGQSPVQSIISGSSFDSHYYKGLLMGRGLLFSDQQLMADSRTAELVNVFASDDGSIFRREFAKSMLKMSNLRSPVENQGDVRFSCSLPNSN